MIIYIYIYLALVYKNNINQPKIVTLKSLTNY